MTTKEPILDGARSVFAQITGTALSSWGMLPDQDHLDSGGYHCGCQDIIRIGKWATAGSSKADYSVRQERDRVGGNVCMGIDGPPKWGNGGDAAWIRHNNMLQQQMAAGDPELGALRAINYTPDGKVKRRYDTHCRSCGIIVSTDTVLWHTHYEFWRNTAGTALLQRTVNRMAQIMRQAITGVAPPVGTGGMSMLCKKGDKGPVVGALQAILLGLGQTITVDNDYGPATAAALKACLDDPSNSGENFGPWEYAALHVREIPRKSAYGKPGPAGPAGKDGAPGAPGKDGESGPKGDAAVLPEGAVLVVQSATEDS